MSFLSFINITLFFINYSFITIFVTNTFSSCYVLYLSVILRKSYFIFKIILLQLFLYCRYVIFSVTLLRFNLDFNLFLFLIITEVIHGLITSLLVLIVIVDLVIFIINLLSGFMNIFRTFINIITNKYFESDVICNLLFQLCIASKVFIQYIFLKEGSSLSSCRHKEKKIVYNDP